MHELNIKNGLIVSGSTTISGSFSVINGGVSSLTASQALSSSYSLSASYISGQSATASNALTASYVSFQNIANKPSLISSSLQFGLSDNFNVNQITASVMKVSTLVVTTITSSVEYASGSNVFGTKSTDTQQFTGSVSISGSLTVNGPISGNITSASFATTASYVLGGVGVPPGTVSSSAQVVADLVGQQINATGYSGSFTGSFTGNHIGSSSYSTTSSYALSASYAPGSSIPNGTVSSSAQIVADLVGQQINAAGYSGSFNGTHTGSFTGSLTGTASFSLSSSYSISASYAPGLSIPAGTVSSSAQIVADLVNQQINASGYSGSFTGSFTGSHLGTSSYSIQSLSSSYSPSPNISPYSIVANSFGVSSPITSSQTIILGIPYFSDTGTIGQWTFGLNNYWQFIIQNTSSGATASADIVINNNAGTPSSSYFNIGKNSTGYLGTGPTSIPAASYVFDQNDDLAIGTVSNKTLHLFVNNTDALVISGSGQAFFTSSVQATSFTGSLLGNATSASYALSASYAPGSPSISASYSVTASYAVSASYAPGSPSISASYAVSASYAPTNLNIMIAYQVALSL